jgi:aromatic amino acid aminotransferase I
LVDGIYVKSYVINRIQTIGPGCRLGWTTCNPLFATVMENYSANKTNQSSGISQAMVMQLVSKQWGYDGYIRWLRGE